MVAGGRVVIRIVQSPQLRPSGTSAVRGAVRVLCVAVFVLPLPAVARAAEGPDDLTVSVGCWDVVAAEWDGDPVDPELVSRLQVVFRADGSWTVLLRRLPVAEGTSSSHQHESPKTFEMETLGSEGIEPRRYRGIYRIDGDTRVFCIVPDGTPRPDEFSAPRHSDRMLVTLRRVRDPASGR